MKAKDKREILAQYKLGYAYTKDQIMRWYGASEREALQIMKQGEGVKRKNATPNRAKV